MVGPGLSGAGGEVWGAPGPPAEGLKEGEEESGSLAGRPRVRGARQPPPAASSTAAGRQAAPAPSAPPPGRGFPGRAGPFHPGSESDVGVNENKRGARGEGRRARRRERRDAGGNSCVGESASRRPVAVVILSPPPPRLARGCLRPRLTAPELHAAAAAPASKGRHVPAARAWAEGG